MEDINSNETSKSQIMNNTDNKVMNDIMIAFLVCLPLINYIIAGIFKTNIGISAPLVLFFLVYSFVKKEFNASLFMIILSLVIIFFFVLSFVNYGINDYNSQYFENYIYYGFLPILFINNNHNGERIIRIMSYISIVAIIMFLSRDYNVYEYGENMKYSNMLLPGGLSVMHQAFTKKKTNKYLRFICIIMFVLYIMLMFIWGTRGSILAVIIYPLLSLLSHTSKWKRIFLIMSFMAASIIFYINLESILFLLRDIFDVLKIQFLGLDRAIALIAYGDFSNGRNELWGSAMKVIFNSGLLGKGISGFEISNISYTHNMFLQLFVEFGPVIGLIFGLGTIFLLIKTIILRSGEKSKEFAILLAASSLIVLQFSTIHWNFVSFWFFIYESYNLVSKGSGRVKIYV